MEIYISGKTDVGLERLENEDAFAFCPDLEMQDWSSRDMVRYVETGTAGAVAVVADGMGGENAGEIASALAVETVRNRFHSVDLPKVASSDESVKAFMEDLFHEADESILDYTSKVPETVGMGTTLTLLWIVGRKAYVAWCGDSRCYLFNKGVGLKSLSKDHSYVQELIDGGAISEDESFEHPDNHIITRCLGGLSVPAEPDMKVYDICAGDSFLLCSDGLCGYCSSTQIAQVLKKAKDHSASDELVRLALKSGGSDNITVAHILLRWSEESKSATFFRKVCRWLGI